MAMTVNLSFRETLAKLPGHRASGELGSRVGTCFECGYVSLEARECGNVTELSCQSCGLKNPQVTLDALGTSRAAVAPEENPTSRSPTGEREEEAFSPPLAFGVYELPPFPTVVFPNWLRLFVEAVSENTQTPADMGAVTALSLLATACAGVAEINAGPDWYEPLNLFTVTVASPGSRKSAVFSAFSRPLVRYEEAVNRDRKTTSETTGTPYEPLRLFADDITTEKLAAKMAEQGGRMAVLSAEGGLFGIAAGLYTEGGRPANIDVLLKGHAGDVLRVDRLKRESLYLPSPALTLGICTQPDVLESLASVPGFRGKGLLARFLFSLPPDNVGHRAVRVKGSPEAVKDDYRRGIERLLLLEPQENEEGERRPYPLFLTPEADALFQTVCEKIEFSLREGQEYFDIKDWGSKLPGAVARIAGLLHLAEHGLSVREVSEKTMRDAAEVGQYFAAHAKAAFGQMGMDAEMNRARKILAWVKRTGEREFTRRAVHNALQGSFPRAEMLIKPLEILCERGFLRETGASPSLGVGRKPGSLYEVNPALFLSS